MKKITENTILVQNNKKYTAIKIDENKIVWVDKDAEIGEFNNGYEWVLYSDLHIAKLIWKTDKAPYIGKIIAATFELEGVPKIELEDEIEKLAKEYSKNEEDYTLKLIAKYSFKDGYKANQAKYTEENMANFGQWMIKQYIIYTNRDENFAERMLPEYLQFINSIKEITVDENFCILNIVN